MSKSSLHLVSLLGSLRKASFNGMVARTLPEVLPSNVTISPLPSFENFPIYNYDVEASSGMPSVVNEMAKLIKEADGVVIVTPEYNYSMPGGLKNCLDWLSRHPDAPLAKKPVAIQTTSMGVIAGARCQAHLRQTLVVLNANTLVQPEFMVPRIQTLEEESATATLKDSGTREHLKKQMQAFADMIFSA